VPSPGGRGPSATSGVRTMLLVVMIAGHSFADTPMGRVCTSPASDGRICCARWLVVRTADECDIGATLGLAHVGTLNSLELEQIRTARAAEEAIAWSAVMETGSCP
jgi:hypothetical protein